MSYIKVSNVSHLVTEENLRELFECCGEINRMRIRNDEGQRVAVIEFSEGHQAETAHMLNNTELGDKKLAVKNLDGEEAKKLLNDDSKKSRALSEYEKACKVMEDMMKGPSGAQDARNEEVKRTIYVGNLSRHCTDEHIREEFGQIGEVVYIKFSGNADFRYAFVEFATEEQARMAFSFHGKVLAGQAIKIGTAHNPVFKDDAQNVDSSMSRAFDAARQAERRHGESRRRRRRSRTRSRSRSRGRKRSRSRDRRRRRRRRRRNDSDEEEEEKPKMFWDGYQWHFNDTNVEDVEEHVTSIIRSDADGHPEIDTQKKMENAAAEALKNLKMARAFNV